MLVQLEKYLQNAVGALGQQSAQTCKNGTPKYTNDTWLCVTTRNRVGRRSESATVLGGRAVVCETQEKGNNGASSLQQTPSAGPSAVPQERRGTAVHAWGSLSHPRPTRTDRIPVC